MFAGLFSQFSITFFFFAYCSVIGSLILMFDTSIMILVYQK